MHWVTGQSRDSASYVPVGLEEYPRKGGGSSGLLQGQDIGGRGPLEAAILEKPGPPHQDGKAPVQTTKRQRTQPHPSANRLLKVPLGTELPLITPRDKAPPIRVTRLSTTHQWSGTSPSQLQACNKPLYQLPPQGQTAEARKATTLQPAKIVQTKSNTK